MGKLFATLTILFAATAAHAQDGLFDEPAGPTNNSSSSTSSSAPSAGSGDAHGLGVGGILTISGLTGAGVVYDMPALHVEGYFLFQDVGPSTLSVGARGWYHLHKGNRSDFSLGGGLGISRIEPPMGGDSTTPFHLELGAQIRAFITDNVSIAADVGLAFVIQDGDDAITLGGNEVYGAGSIIYYFE